MRQRNLTKEEQDEAKSGYPELYKHRMTTFAGFAFDFVDKNTFDDSEEERQKFFEDLWDKGKRISCCYFPLGALTMCRRLPFLARYLQRHAV